MTSPAERIARLETRLDTVIELVEKMDGKLDELREEFSEDKADLAAIKNKGTGILIGVAMGAAAIGAGLKSILFAVIAAFK